MIRLSVIVNATPGREGAQWFGAAALGWGEALESA
jgi:hypothetical protein